MGIGRYAFEETVESIINSSKLLLCKIPCLEMILVWWEPPSTYSAAAAEMKNMLSCTFRHNYIYILYVCVCVCMCVWSSMVEPPQACIGTTGGER